MAGTGVEIGRNGKTGSTLRSRLNNVRDFLLHHAAGEAYFAAVAEGDRATSLVPTTFSGFGPNMIHVTSGAQFGGLVQVLGSVNTGPASGYSSAWVYVVSGTVGMGAGNGGNTGVDTSTSTLNTWVHLQANFGATPANEFIIYGTAGSEFYVAFASVVGQPSDYGQTNNCGSSLAAGASCAINVTFTPTTTGPRSGSVWITDNAAGSPQTVSLTGTGITPVSVSPPSLNFGNQTVGTSSVAQTVTLSNPGGIPLSISSIIAGANLLQNPAFSQRMPCSCGNIGLNKSSSRRNPSKRKPRRRSRPKPA